MRFLLALLLVLVTTAASAQQNYPHLRFYYPPVWTPSTVIVEKPRPSPFDNYWKEYRLPTSNVVIQGNVDRPVVGRYNPKMIVNPYVK